jgi:hypothetical protein
MFFLLGALCNKLKVFETRKRSKKFYVLSNVVNAISIGIFTVVALNLFFNMIDPGRNYYFISGTIDVLVYYLTALLSMLSLLHILIYTFRFNFNKSNGLMRELNKNSYAVYIIHIVVMGVIALLLINVNVPTFFKYLILTILTLVISNVIATVYRRVFKKSLSKNFIRIAIPVAASLLAIVVYVKQANSTEGKVRQDGLLSNVGTSEISLHTAVIQGNLEAVQKHIDAGLNPDEREPSGGSSPLITASLFGEIEIAILLVESGADVNFRNNDGSTPLHTAAFFCQTEIVESLLANGADASIKNNAGSTALESVEVPFEYVKGIYDYFGQTFGPFGLELDYGHIKETRPVIARLLQ